MAAGSLDLVPPAPDVVPVPLSLASAQEALVSPFTAWGQGRRCGGPAAPLTLPWAPGLLVSVLACLPWPVGPGPTFQPAAAHGKLSPGEATVWFPQHLSRRDGGPGGRWRGSLGLRGRPQASAGGGPSPCLGPVPCTTSRSLVPSVPHGDAGARAPPFRPVSRPLELRAWGWGAQGPAGLQGPVLWGDALYSCCRLRLFRELLQQPVPDPQDRGAQQGSVCVCGLRGWGSRATGGLRAGPRPFVRLSPGSLA